MRYSTAFLDDVRDRVKLSAIVGASVLWDKRKTRAAKGDYWACCPFHAEKSPSFHVDDRKGMYHCFGCGVTGNHFKFLMEHRGKSFPDAVQEIAQQAGVPLPEVTPEARAVAARRLTLVEANERAAAWFQARLKDAPAILEYAASRGLTREELTAFRIGFAPGGNAMVRAHIGADDELVAAGVLGRSEEGGRLYDRFSDRLIFPIMDARGKVIGFSGRDTTGKHDAKYLNTPATEIFDKSAVLYNFAAAKDAAWAGKQLIVTEGQIDVIAGTRANYAAVAPLGTALTDQHVQHLIKLAEEPVLCFDGDAAGRKAAARAIDLVLPHVSPAFTVRIATMPEGEDVDSIVKRGASHLQKLVHAAQPLADALWQRETTTASRPEDRAKMEGALRQALKMIRDADMRRAYGLDFKDRLESLGKRPTVYRSNSYSQHSTSPAAMRLVSGFRRTGGLSLKEAILIGAIAAAPQAALDQAENLSADDRLSPEAVELIGKLVMALSVAPERAIGEVLEASGLSAAVDDALAKASAAGVQMEIGSEGAEAMGILTSTRRH